MVAIQPPGWGTGPGTGVAFRWQQGNEGYGLGMGLSGRGLVEAEVQQSKGLLEWGVVRGQ